MMHTNRSNLWLAPAVFGWIAAVPVYAVDNAASSADKTGRDAAVGHAGARSSIRPMDADPDGKPVAILPPREAAASQLGDCQVIGGFETLFEGMGRYRANIYRVEFTNAVLTEIRMELSFSGMVNLHFSVHRARSDAMEQIFRRDERMMEDCVSRDAEGDGTPQFYPCTLLTPLTLEAGYDYAIGVAWGSASEGGGGVTYGRDSANYPLPFLHGQVLGLVLINTAPRVDDDLQFSVVFSGGAYSMQLCFDPVLGACCIPPDADNPSGRCAPRFPGDCIDPGGFFHGQRTTCSELGGACVFGACCNLCGECLPDHTPDACEAEDGVWQGVGVECTGNLCPATTGACCFAKSPCEELCARDCAEGEGAYRGDDSTCDPDPCQGACCIPNFCFDETPIDCADRNGTYRGDGTTCATLPPGNECGGACCRGASDTLDFCEQISRRSLCTFEDFPVSAYLGDRTLCPSGFDFDCGETADYATCCLPNGTCINTTPVFCNQSWVGGVSGALGSTCDAETCTAGACCFSDGSCQILTESACPTVDWTAVDAGGTCDPNTCTVPMGACCLCDGSCQNLTEAACGEENGLYQGDDPSGDPCGTVACEAFGACCRPNGNCADNVTSAECEAFGGDVAGGDWFVCDTCDSQNVACPVLGACCSPQGNCGIVLRDECEARGDSFVGAGVLCGAGICPTGACCSGSDCAEITRSACDATGGDYQGDDSGCETVTCPNVEGACCLGGGSCQDLLALDCSGVGGSFQSPGTSCDDGACVLGACCLVDHSCFPDQVLLQCAAEGGEFHAETSCAVPGLCDPTGACCNNGACTIEAETNCTDSDGIYQGDDAGCDTGLCTLGACCHLDGTCDDDTLRSQCVGANDVFHPDLLCANVCIARGACCIDDQGCQVLTEQLCANRGGVYDGGGTKCRENLCTPGACCLPDEDETCDDTLTLQLCESEVTGGAYIGPDALCADVDCTRGSCCAADATCTDGRVLLQCQDPEDFSLNDCSSCVGRGACCRPTGEAEPCEILTRDECLGTGGTLYVGDATTCGSSPCIGIDSSSPPDCAIDARQPSDPDGSNPVGWDSIEITFDGDTTGLSDVDFTVSLDPGPGDPPTIVGVSTTGNTATLELNPPIPAGQWTCFTHDAGGTSTCLGFLPADSDGDGVSAGADIQRLIDCISDVAACELWECDLDRSGLCGPADILRGVDLLNGAAQYARWLDAPPLPFCPSGQ